MLNSAFALMEKVVFETDEVASDEKEGKEVIDDLEEDNEEEDDDKEEEKKDEEEETI